MNKKFILAIFLCLVITLALSGCAAIKATDTAKVALIEYYDYFSDEDIDECIDMLGEEIIDDLGSEDDTEIILYSRRYLMGEVEDSKVKSFDSDGTFSEVTVVLDVETKYENYDEYLKEQYIFNVSGSDVEIIGFDLDKEPVPDEMIKEYFENFTEMNEVKNMYIPYVINTEGYFNEESVQMQADYASDAGGEYKDHDIEDYYYYYSKLDWDDDIYYIYQLDAEMEFENEEFLLYAEISKENRKIGFNYLEFYPKSAYEVLVKYFENIDSGDTRAILNMYAPGFFDISAMTAEEWEENVLKVYTTEYGKLVEYTVTSWDYSLIEYNGTEIEVYGFYVTTELEGGIFNEYIMIEKGKTQKAIVGHQIN